jgi:hypothetical protein
MLLPTPVMFSASCKEIWKTNLVVGEVCSLLGYAFLVKSGGEGRIGKW